jgi:hypothetical protein
MFQVHKSCQKAYTRKEDLVKMGKASTADDKLSTARNEKHGLKHG